VEDARDPFPHGQRQDRTSLEGSGFELVVAERGRAAADVYAVEVVDALPRLHGEHPQVAREHCSDGQFER
jgi:hypothetical protein